MKSLTGSSELTAILSQAGVMRAGVPRRPSTLRSLSALEPGSAFAPLPALGPHHRLKLPPALDLPCVLELTLILDVRRVLPFTSALEWKFALLLGHVPKSVLALLEAQLQLKMPHVRKSRSVSARNKAFGAPHVFEIPSELELLTRFGSVPC